MSDPVSQPDDEADWSHLPQDPVGFFRLEGGFDARDLKRAYNRLLRRYKPEKHPEEFQRIRAAYEELDQRLRYGVAVTPQATGSWEGSPDDSAEVPGHGEAPVDPLEALAKEIESGDATLAKMHARLKGQPNKTAADYYALALLGDATQPIERQSFLQWLLKGIATHPGELALERLLHGYLASQAPEELLPRILLTCAKQIWGDAYYRITETGWDRLLRGPSADHFATLLQRCQGALAEHPGGDPAISAQITFTIHALRFALWKDRSHWADGAFAFLDENFDQVPPHLEHELDTLMFVREYIEHRESFVAGHPLAAELDATLEAAFTQDQIEADQRVLACQQRLSEASGSLSKVFPLEGQPAHNSFFSLWSWVSEDAAARTSLPEESESDIPFWRRRIATLLMELKDQDSATGVVWGLAGVVRTFAIPAIAMTLFGVTAVTVMSLAVYLGEKVMGSDQEELIWISLGISLLCATVVAVVAWKRIAPFIDNRIWGPFCNRMAKRCYRRLWRTKLLEFVRHSSLDYFTFRDLVSEQANRTNDERSWMGHFVSQDYGLAMTALAQRFRN